MVIVTSDEDFIRQIFTYKTTNTPEMSAAAVAARQRWLPKKEN
jgi:hypothetical protein